MNGPHESLEIQTAAHEEAAEQEIAIVGMSGRFPGARDLAGFWSNLENGREALVTLSDEELLAAGVPRSLLSRPGYIKAASSIEEVEAFDAEFFGYNARDAEIIDPQQRLFLEHAWTALEDAGYRADGFDGLIGVYAGVAWNTYLLSNLVSHPELFEDAGAFQMFISNDKDFMPTRVAYKLNLGGPAILVQTSCSTSLVATHLACLGLQSWECDLALVGGVTVKVPQQAGYFYQEGGLASPDGHCRTFDERAAGTVFGSGVGVVALKRLADARRDGDTIRAVIKGSAINNDGSAKVSYTAPSVEGQAEVVAAAQEMAGVDLETIRYIECHGTATALGDPIEVRALNKVFSASTERRGFCALGSVKANVGHLDAAAGVAGLIKTTLALEHGKIPPIPGFERPNPAIDFDASPFYPAAVLEDWERLNDAPRRAGVSSFGVGGTNAHVILEEAPAAAVSDPSRPWQLLALSARSAAALEQATANLQAHLKDPKNAADLADVAWTLFQGRTVFRHRRLVLAHDGREAVAALAGELPGQVWSSIDRAEPRDRPVAFLFSGQGSQYLGMARGLYDQEEVFRAAIDRTAEVLEPELGLRLQDLLWPADPEASGLPSSAPGAADRLRRTRFAQPALFAVEWALTELWKSWGVVPQAMLGHSIGEWVAACVGGTLDLEDALRLVALRGRLMDGLPAGSMLAVPLGEEELEEFLATAPELSIAALNEPSRTVVSGPSAALEAFAAHLAERGLEARPLHTSHAFHSAMMDPVLTPFAEHLAGIDFKAPEIPWVSNVTGTWITPEEAMDPTYWTRHLRQSVRFSDGVATLLQAGDRVLLEVGPGRALATLALRHPQRQAEQPVLSSLRHPQDEASHLGEDSAQMLISLGRLWLAGVEIDPTALYAGEHRRRVPLPTYPFERQRFWIEPGVAQARPEASGQREGLRQRPEIDHWFYLPSFKPAPLPAAGDGEGPRSWLVFERREAGLGTSLRASGDAVTRVELGMPRSGFVHHGAADYTVDPADVGAWQALSAALLGAAQSAEAASTNLAVIYAWSLGTPPMDNPQDALVVEQREGFAGFLSLLRLLAQPAGQGIGGASGVIDLLVVADQIKALVAGERVRPEKAPLLGLCRVVPEELPEVHCRVIDVAVPADARAEQRLAEALVAEVRSAEVAEVIALRGRLRYIETFEPTVIAEPAEGALTLREGGVYVFTGGLRGNGYAFARYLARAWQARLLLLEDSGLAALRGDEAQEEQLRITERHATVLQELGGEVHRVEIDFTETSAWHRALAEGEEHFGGLHGVFHAASTVGPETFRALSEIDPEHLALHFRGKVHGALGLDAALRARQGPPPDFCILLSSLASVLGGLAYGAYAAANHFLDAWAQSPAVDPPTASTWAWQSVGWDVWEFEDESEQITALRPDLAQLAMTPRQGELALLRVLRFDVEHVLVSTADLATRLAERRRRIAAHGTPAATTTARARHVRPELQTPYLAPSNELERQIVEIWQEFLGFETIGTNDNFFELGGDSFIAVRVAARLREALQVELPVAQLFQRLTIRSLAEFLAQDTASADAERAAHLADRRESMKRRQNILERRRARKKR